MLYSILYVNFHFTPSCHRRFKFVSFSLLLSLTLIFVLFQAIAYGNYYVGKYACWNNIHWETWFLHLKNFEIHFWLYPICHCHKLIAVGCRMYAPPQYSLAVPRSSLFHLLSMHMCMYMRIVHAYVQSTQTYAHEN